jgi:hypothetical protein
MLLDLHQKGGPVEDLMTHEAYILDVNGSDASEPSSSSYDKREEGIREHNERRVARSFSNRVLEMQNVVSRGGGTPSPKGYARISNS